MDVCPIAPPFSNISFDSDTCYKDWKKFQDTMCLTSLLKQPIHSSLTPSFSIPADYNDEAESNKNMLQAGQSPQQISSTQEDTMVQKESLASGPYHPVTNYLAPRPQFLFYNPNRRREYLSWREYLSSLQDDEHYPKDAVNDVNKVEDTVQREYLSFENGKNNAINEVGNAEDTFQIDRERKHKCCSAGIVKTLFFFTVIFLSTSWMWHACFESFTSHSIPSIGSSGMVGIRYRAGNITIDGNNGIHQWVYPFGQSRIKVAREERTDFMVCNAQVLNKNDKIQEVESYFIYKEAGGVDHLVMEVLKGEEGDPMLGNSTLMDECVNTQQPPLKFIYNVSSEVVENSAVVVHRQEETDHEIGNSEVVDEDIQEVQYEFALRDVLTFCDSVAYVSKVEGTSGLIINSNVTYANFNLQGIELNYSHDASAIEFSMSKISKGDGTFSIIHNRERKGNGYRNQTDAPFYEKPAAEMYTDNTLHKFREVTVKQSKAKVYRMCVFLSILFPILVPICICQRIVPLKTNKKLVESYCSEKTSTPRESLAEFVGGDQKHPQGTKHRHDSALPEDNVLLYGSFVSHVPIMVKEKRG